MSSIIIQRDELIFLRGQALQLRRARLTAIARSPERHGWPDEFLAPGRTKRGEQGVELGVLANALGCNPQALTSRIGPPLGAVAVGSRAVDVYSPALLETLYDHPSVAKSRERRVQNLRDTERYDELRSVLAETKYYRLQRATVANFRSIKARADIPLDTLTVLIGKNAAGKSSIVDGIRIGLDPTTDVPYRLWPSLEFIVSGTPSDTDRSSREIAAYCAIGVSDDMAAVLIPVAEQLLSHPTLIGKPGEWYAALCTDQLAIRPELIRAQLSSTDSKSRFITELLRAALCADSPPPYAPIRRLQSKTPPIHVTVLGAQESIGKRLFELMPEIAQLNSRDVTSYFEEIELDDSEESEGDEESGDPSVEEPNPIAPDDDARRFGVNLGATRSRSGTVTCRWTDSEGAIALPARATHLELALVAEHERTWRLAIADVPGIRSVLDELTALQDHHAGPIPVGLERASLTLAQLVGLWGPSREISPWFSNSDGMRRRTLACLYLVETIANKLSPDFIAEAGRIALLPPQHPGTEIVGVGLLESDGSFTGINQLASGIARWVVLLVDFAESLARERWRAATSAKVGFEDVSDEMEFAKALARRAAGSPVSQLASIQLLLADEPELHLHPAAQEDIARWAVNISKTSTVLVATHAPAFLRLSPVEASLVRVSRGLAGSTVTSQLDGDFLQRIEALADDIGLGQDRILQLLRGLVVVEGEADGAVIRKFARSVINRYRLAVVPIGGHSRAKSLAEGDLALAIGLPIAVMFDETTAKDVARLQADRRAKVPDEVKSLGRVLSLRDKGLRCQPIYFDAPDIIAAIPEATVRRRFAKFSTWRETLDEWTLGAEGSFKNFVLDSWNVSRSRDLATIEELVADRRPDDALPDCINRSIKELEAWAETLGLGTGTYT